MSLSHLLARQSESTIPAFALLMLLVSGDLAFTALHLINVETGWLNGIRISLEADGGPAEVFQYVKEFWVVVCLMVAFLATRHAAYIGWSLVFLFLLADDAGQIHENAGTWLSQQYDLPAPFGLRPKDIGELIFAAFAGLGTAVVIGVAVWRGSEQCRRITRDLGCLLVVLAGLGVAVDTLHVIAYFGDSLLAQVLLVVEDGGEMLVMSAMTAYAFHVAMHVGRTRFDLWSLVRTVLEWDVTLAWRPAPAVKTNSSVMRALPANREPR